MKFTKMHGIGNDYVYVNGFTETVPDPSALAVKISDRHFGVGSDGLVLILPSDGADFRMRMFNADGSEAEMCGNAIRCVAKYVYERGITAKRQIAIETLAGVMVIDIHLDGNAVTSLSVNMGRPILERERIPVAGSGPGPVNEPLVVGGRQFAITCVGMGNPHCVIYVDDVTRFAVAEIGSMIEHHKMFPNRTNVEFVQVLGPGEVRQRTWERGAGETLACGTGASAVTVAGVLTGRTERRLLNHLVGGDLELTWADDAAPVIMTGPAETVFEGEWPE